MREILTFVLVLLLSNLFGQNTIPKLQITKLTNDFFVFTTYKSFKGNPFPSNGMYLLTDKGVVIFDTPWDTTQFQPLLDSIKLKHNMDVVMCIATHSHEDRTGGLEYYKNKGIKTYSTKLTDQICIERNEKRAQFLIEKDTVFKVGQYSFQTNYLGKGHTPDNIVIWFKNEKVLYGGCLIKSVQANDLGNLADANITEWEKTIKNIQRKFKKPKFIVTGHQDWKSKKSIKHTLKLIQQYKKENYR